MVGIRSSQHRFDTDTFAQERTKYEILVFVVGARDGRTVEGAIGGRLSFANLTRPVHMRWSYNY